MSKIRLLLSCKSNTQNYIDAFGALGAETVAEYLPSVDTQYDGLVLCGGGDIDPKYFGEELNGSYSIDIERDKAEFALLKAYVDAGKPIMGICRGHQIINVFFGGTLYQHLPEAELHKSHEGNDSIHAIKAVSDSVLAKLYGESFFTNSSHHQSLKELGEGIRATAYWNDKYIEAIEHTERPILGVQWHPERMCFNHERSDTVCGADILKYFIDMCQAHRDNL